jgi:CMP-N-acetylneuraminic acid synthetase
MQMMDEENFRADVVIQLAPTCPFISSERIAQSVELISEYDCDSAVSLQRIEHSHPYRARILDEDGYFDNYISDIDIESIHSRQDLPVLYCTSGGLYTRKRELLEQYDGADFALGEKRKGIVVDDYEAINIDRPIDFEFAEFLVGNGHVEHLISK